MKPIEFGYRGYYGAYTNPNNNIISNEMNKLIDEYNSKINSFQTLEEQKTFNIEINQKLKILSNKIEKIDYNI